MSKTIDDNRKAREAAQVKMDAVVVISSSEKNPVITEFIYDATESKNRKKVVILEINSLENDRYEVIFRYIGDTKQQYKSTKNRNKLDERIRQHFSI